MYEETQTRDNFWTSTVQLLLKLSKPNDMILTVTYLFMAMGLELRVSKLQISRNDVVFLIHHTMKTLSNFKIMKKTQKRAQKAPPIQCLIAPPIATLIASPSRSLDWFLPLLWGFDRSQSHFWLHFPILHQVKGQVRFRASSEIINSGLVNYDSSHFESCFEIPGLVALITMTIRSIHLCSNNESFITNNLGFCWIWPIHIDCDIFLEQNGISHILWRIKWLYLQKGVSVCEYSSPLQCCGSRSELICLSSSISLLYVKLIPMGEPSFIISEKKSDLSNRQTSPNWQMDDLSILNFLIGAWQFAGCQKYMYLYISRISRPSRASIDGRAKRRPVHLWLYCEAWEE